MAWRIRPSQHFRQNTWHHNSLVQAEKLTLALLLGATCFYGRTFQSVESNLQRLLFVADKTLRREWRATAVPDELPHRVF